MVLLGDGVSMPRIGLGTYRMAEGGETETAVREALALGYRLLDTAKLYGNERSVGRAVRASAVPREEVFVTTKLWPTDFWRPERAFERSFEKLGLGYIDLYLVHFPIPFVPRNVWRTLERLYAEKRVRAIGVSNYSVAQLSELLSWCSVPPAVNQVRFNPYAYKKDVLEFCQTHRIVLEAHTPLAEGRATRDPRITRIAQGHGRSPAQVALRWALQHEAIVIPKSTRRERLAENVVLFDFELSSEEMRALDML